MGELYVCLNAFSVDAVKDMTMPGLEKWYYISQITSSVVLIITLIVAVAQYFFHKDEYKNNYDFNVKLHEHKKREKALELAGFYKNNILGHTLMFSRVYAKIGIKQKLDQIRKSDMKAFDEYELEKNLTPTDIEWIKKRTKSNEFFVALLNHQHIHGEERFAADVKFEDLTKPEIQDKLGTGYKDAHMKLLNNLEFFAMHFINGVADEEIVYQSLHKTYVEILELFYFDICLNNVKDGSKLFTNAIALYNNWKERAEKEREKREEVYRGCGNYEKKP